MNVTNADYFTFNVHHSLLLLGQTGTGKTVLVDKLITGLVNSHTADELKFELLDMTGVDFWLLRDHYPNYVSSDLKYYAEPALATLEYLAEMSSVRKDSRGVEQLLFVMIEECNMSILDQARFDNAVVTINRNARDANMKLLYSTSRPGPKEVSGKLSQSFDLILAAELSREDRDRLELPVADNLSRYDFTVTER